MALTRYRIGEFVELHNEKCGIANLTPYDISGVNSDKEFFEPSNQVGADTTKYKNVPNGYFACNLMHVGRDAVLPIAMNHSGKTKVVSPAYSTFSFDGKGVVIPEYFFIFLKSQERDRYFWFHTDSSVRDGMTWQDFCDLEIDLPPIEVQKRYVAIYNSMLENQRCYEHGLDDLKLVCDGYIEDLRKKYPLQRLESFITRQDERNSDNAIKNVKGVSTSKVFRDPTSKVDRENLQNYKIVHPRQFSFVQTTHNEKVFAYALNLTSEDIVVTSVNEVFSVDESQLVPEYLALFFNRTEFDRYARYHSWGSARETFVWSDLCDVTIPVPSLEVQRSIADIYSVFCERRAISERLKNQIKNLCPILIKGSLEEASRR